MRRIFTKPEKGSVIFLLPSLFTLGAICSGLFAIISSINHEYLNAIYLIFLSMILDSIDGRIARLTHTSSLFGAQLDSLSDMVSFGVAPALIIYNYQLHLLGKIGAVITFIYVACVALRLARFNTMLAINDKRFFIGLPSTAAAPIIAGYVWLSYSYALSSHIFVILGAVITLFIAFSMVNNVRFYSFKEFNIRHKARFRVLLISLLVLVFLVIDPELSIYIVFVGYVVISYVIAIMNFIKNSKKNVY